LDSSLTSEQEAESNSFSILISEKLYPIMLWNWFMESENFEKVSEQFGYHLIPFPLNYIIPFQKKMRISDQLSPFKKMDKTEIYRQASECYEALSSYLGNNEFFFGNKPTSFDAIVYGHLSCHFFISLKGSNLRTLLKKHENLVNYCNRIYERYFKNVSGSIGTSPTHIKLSKDLSDENINQTWNVLFTIGAFIIAGLYGAHFQGKTPMETLTKVKDQ